MKPICMSYKLPNSPACKYNDMVSPLKTFHTEKKSLDEFRSHAGSALTLETEEQLGKEIT